MVTPSKPSLESAPNISLVLPKYGVINILELRLIPYVSKK